MVKIPETYKYISAFLTMRCNLQCSYCLNRFSEDFNRTKFKEMTGKDWINSLNKLDSKEDVPITFSGGEPFLHPDFVEIINWLKPELKIDILTNLTFKPGIKKFLEQVKPERINRNSKYPSIRVSYHPEQMGDGEEVVKNAKMFKDAGFNIGIYSVLHPSPSQLSAINQMQFRCLEAGIPFRLKEFTGTYNGELYGNYSKYPNSFMQEKTKKCKCKTTELLMGPDGKVYRCHRDLFSEQNPIGSITEEKFDIQDIHRDCIKYGQCHPCDVKIKTNHKQELGHTSVDIKDIK